jgi:ABC-type nickel/cobalt efflux system permease component RcnA
MQWSRTLQGKIAEFARLMKEEGSISYGVAAFLSAMLFGIVHVAGPGHGKVFTISYFGSKKSSFREGLLLSGLINVVDSLSAGILVLLGNGLLTVVFTELRGNAVYYVQLVSYGLVTLFGITHLIHLFATPTMIMNPGVAMKDRLDPGAIHRVSTVSGEHVDTRIRPGQRHVRLFRAPGCWSFLRRLYHHGHTRFSGYRR